MPQVRKLDISLDYTPRDWQHKVHCGLARVRRGLLICSRQIGKTTLACPELVERVVGGPTNTSHAYLCPAASQAKKIVWPQLMLLLEPMKDYIEISVSEMSVKFPGERRLYILGAQAGENLRGLSLKSLIVDERDSIDNDLFRSVVLPMLNNYLDDSFILYIGTLKGRALWNMYLEHRDDPDWYCAVVKGSESGCYTPAQLAEMRSTMAPAAYEREIECNPNAPVENSVLGTKVAEVEHAGRVCRLPYVAGSEVHVSFDIGIRDYTTVWGWQLRGRSIEYLFYRYWSDTGMADILGELMSHYPGYRWGEAILPHDAKNRDKVTAYSVKDLFYERWPGPVYQYTAAPSPVATLQSARINLDRSWFDERGCEDGLLALKQARYNTRPDGTVLDTINHDKYSHGLDGFRYGCHRIETLHSTMSPQSMSGHIRTPKVIGSI